MNKRPSARRIRPSLPAVAPEPISWTEANEKCKRVTGLDARTVAVLAIQEDLEQDVLDTLPKDDAVQAVAILLAGRSMPAATQVAQAIVAIVKGEKSSPFSS